MESISPATSVLVAGAVLSCDIEREPTARTEYTEPCLPTFSRADSRGVAIGEEQPLTVDSSRQPRAGVAHLLQEQKPTTPFVKPWAGQGSDHSTELSMSAIIS